MKVTWKRGLGICLALALVIALGVYSSDHFLKATDGEENYITDLSETGEAADPAQVAEVVEPEEEPLVQIESGEFESDLTDEDLEWDEDPDAGEPDGEAAEEPAAGENEPDAAKPGSGDEKQPGTDEPGEDREHEGERGDFDATDEDPEGAEPEAADLEDEKDKSVAVSYSIIGNTYKGAGTVLKLTATTTGYDDPTYQWQYNDGSGWQNYEGETGASFLLDLTSENLSWTWRVQAGTEASQQDAEFSVNDVSESKATNVQHYRLRVEDSSNITLYTTAGDGTDGLRLLGTGEEVVTTETYNYFFVRVLDGYKAETTFTHSYACGDASRTDYPTWTGTQYSIYQEIDNPDPNYIMPQQNAAIAAGCTYKFEYTGTTGKLANFWAEFAIKGIPIEVKVKYNKGDVEGNVKDIPTDNGTYYHENVTEYSTHTITIPSTAPTADGKTFVTWRGSDGKDYNPGDTISVKSIWNTVYNDSNYTLTLTAIWDSSVSVSYDGNGNTSIGNLEDPHNPYEVGATATVLKNTWKRYNYEFVCWNTKADGSGTSYNPGDTITLEKSITLYAQWKEKAKAVINYKKTTGGTVSIDKEILEPDDGDAVGSTAVADEEDYYFVGWQDEDGNIVSTDTTYIPDRPTNGWGDGLTVTAVFKKKPTVYIVSQSESVLYDGAVHQVTGYTVNGVMEDTFIYEGEIYTIHGLTASSEEGKNAGTYPVTFKEKNFKIVDSAGNNVTTLFKINKKEGALVINKRTLTMTSEDAAKEYDGKPLTATVVRITGDGFVNGEGATYAFLNTSTITEVGSAENKFKYSLNKETESSNYDITKVYGTLTVTNPVAQSKYVITITAKDENTYYNGKSQTPVGTIKETKFSLSEYGLVLTVSGLSAKGESAKDAGSYPINIVGTATVTDQNGNDVTNKCVINFKSGTFTIKPRPIVLTSADVEKSYDGSPLTGNSVTDALDLETLENEAGFVTWEGIENEPGFVGGDGADYTFTECITSGIGYNDFTYTPKSGTNLSNYKIRVTRGRLTVTAPVASEVTRQTIELVPNSKDAVYDGNEQSVSGFETTTFTFDDKTYEVTGIESVATGTEPGTYPTHYSGEAKVLDSEGNDVTDQFEVKIPNDGALKILGVYTLTINYVDAAGRSIAPSYRQAFAEGTVFAPIITPAVEGYAPQFSSVSCPDGGMPNRDITVNVIYKKILSDTDTGDNGGNGGTDTNNNGGTDTNNGTGDNSGTEGTGTTGTEDTTGTEGTGTTGTEDTTGTEGTGTTGTGDNNGTEGTGNAGTEGTGGTGFVNTQNEVNDDLIPVPTAVDDATTTISDEEAPKGVLTFDEDGNPAIVEIEDEQTALAAGGNGVSWALVNLIASIATVITCILLLIAYLRGRKNSDKENDGTNSEENKDAAKDEDDEEEEKKRGRNALRIGSLVPAIASVIIFIVTEDITLPMAYVDKWTILMIVLFAAELVLAIVSRKKKEDDDADDDAKQTAR